MARLPYPLPAGLESLRLLGRGWPEWLARLPALADEITDTWELTYDGEPWSGLTAMVAPVVDAAGRRAALKLGRVDEESAGETVALQQWAGQGAVELWGADPRRGVLLLERLGPGDLTEAWDLDACREVGELYGLLHRPPSPRLRDVRELVTRWLEQVRTLPRGAAPPRFVEQALTAAPRLLAEEPSAVIHGDLHYENVLAGERRDWLVIDPKGFAGDPAYEPAPALWNRWDELGDDPGNGIRERFFTLVDTAELDERRARDWVVLRSVIGVAWEHTDAAGRPLTEPQREWVTRMVTTAKAMQEV